MFRKRKWNNVSGQFSVELILPFLSSGYYDPGRTYGDPYYCYPPEGEDERLPDGNAYISLGPDKTIELTKEQTEQLFDYFLDEIQEIELNDDY